MSPPAPGQYHIYNTLTGQFGEKLAATFHGVDQTLIVDTLTPNRNQQLWRVDDQQAIHPFNADDRSAHDAGGAVGISLTSQSWIITGDDNGYTIKNNGGAAWHAVDRGGAEIQLGSGSGQLWKFEKV